MATVLIVEDEILLADCYARWLMAEGYKTQHALNAQAAIDAIDEQPPQVILLDILLSGANGVQVLHMLRSHIDIARIPVILCSSALPQNMSDLASYGVRGTLDKPTLTRQKLAAAVAGVL